MNETVSSLGSMEAVVAQTDVDPPNGTQISYSDKDQSSTVTTVRNLVTSDSLQLVSTPIYEVGKTLAARIQGLMTEASALSRWEREEQSTEELSKHVALALQNQREINQANIRMSGMTYALTLANVCATKRLQAQVQQDRAVVKQLETEIEDYSLTIDSLNTSIAHLEEETGMYKKQTDDLKDALEHNTGLLKKSLQQQREDKIAHDLALARQLSQINKILHGKIRHDAVIDAILGIFSVCLANTTLIDGPIQFALLLIPKRRLRMWLHQFLKATTALGMLRYLRNRAQQIGWHNSVGSLLPYAKALANTGMWMLFEPSEPTPMNLKNTTIDSELCQ
eukprot:m.49920 g.49920  ORF g.49920 m.49920 type:complete len:337 (+) comp15345_c0_seq1:110-1120(+)